jgi:hypothetical protein
VVFRLAPVLALAARQRVLLGRFGVRVGLVVGEVAAEEFGEVVACAWDGLCEGVSRGSEREREREREKKKRRRRNFLRRIVLGRASLTAQGYRVSPLLLSAFGLVPRCLCV